MIWAQRDDGRIALRLLTDRGAEARAAIKAQAARLEDLLTTNKLTVRFPAPLTASLLSQGGLPPKPNSFPSGSI